MGLLKYFKAVRLISNLKHGNDSIQNQSEISLLKIGRSAVKPLIKVLNKNESPVSEKAARILGSIKDIRSIDPLIASLKSINNSISLASFDALEKIGTPAIESLIKALNKNECPISEKAAMILGSIKDTHSIDPLIISLKSQNNSISLASNDALVKIGKPCIEPLIISLKDKVSSVNEKAAIVLGKIGDDVAIPPLIDALNESNNINEEIFRNILIKFGESVIIPLFHNLPMFNESIMMKTARVLREFDDVLIRKQLIDFLKQHDDYVCQLYSQLILKIGNPAVELLISILKEGINDFNSAVSRAFNELSIENDEPLVLKYLVYFLCHGSLDYKIHEILEQKIIKNFGVQAIEPILYEIKQSQYKHWPAKTLEKLDISLKIIRLVLEMNSDHYDRYKAIEELSIMNPNNTIDDKLINIFGNQNYNSEYWIEQAKFMKSVEFIVKTKQGNFSDYKKNNYYCRSYEFNISAEELEQIKSKLIIGLQYIPTISIQDWESFDNSSCFRCYDTQKDTVQAIIARILNGLKDPGDYRLSVKELEIICKLLKYDMKNFDPPYMLSFYVLRKYYQNQSDFDLYKVVKSETGRYKVVDPKYKQGQF
jgi:HEAT repeat protein